MRKLLGFAAVFLAASGVSALEFSDADIVIPQNASDYMKFAAGELSHHLKKITGGNFRITEDGIKDCTYCLVPHARNGYGYVIGKYSEISALVSEQIRRQREAQDKDQEKVEE